MFCPFAVGGNSSGFHTTKRGSSGIKEVKAKANPVRNSSRCDPKPSRTLFLTGQTDGSKFITSSCPIFKPVLCFSSYNKMTCARLNYYSQMFLFIIREEKGHGWEKDSD